MKTNLKNATFIIPVKIDSQDRLDNITIVLNYLHKHLDTNIILYEHDDSPKLFELSQKLKVKYIFEPFKGSKYYDFHRTKFLNQMILLSETDVIVNYDADALIPATSCQESYKRIYRENHDFVYPFGYGNWQREIKTGGPKSKILETLDLDSLENSDYADNLMSEYGHVVFAKRKSYIECFLENEKFRPDGPEDKERFFRFKKLERKISWVEDSYIYHLEHSRQLDKRPSNPHYGQNMELFVQLMQMDKEELLDYYSRQEYLNKYKCI